MSLTPFKYVCEGSCYLVLEVTFKVLPDFWFKLFNEFCDFSLKNILDELSVPVSKVLDSFGLRNVFETFLMNF